MKTTYTIMAILATALFTQTAAAKLGDNRSTMQPANKIEIDIEHEIISNINEMLVNLQAPATTSDVVKQIDVDSVQLQTNELVQDVAEKLPEFKFKVIIAD